MSENNTSAGDYDAFEVLDRVRPTLQRETGASVVMIEDDAGNTAAMLGPGEARAWAAELIMQAEQIEQGCTLRERSADAAERWANITDHEPGAWPLTLPAGAAELLTAAEQLEAAGLPYAERLIRAITGLWDPTTGTVPRMALYKAVTAALTSQRDS